MDSDRHDPSPQAPSPSPSANNLSKRLDALFQQPPMRRAPTLKWLSGSTQDAINTPLPARPQPARLQQQSSLRTSHAVMHPPPFFDNLTRSTLPTASVSPPLKVYASSSSYTDGLSTSAEPVEYDDDSLMPDSPMASAHNAIPRPPPIVLSSAQPTRSSIDSLRSVSTRSMSTYSSSSSSASIAVPEVGLPPSPNVSLASFLPSWLQAVSAEAKNNTNKEALLSEEDKNPKEDIKKKYLSPKNPVVFCHGLLGFDSVTIGPSLAPFEVTHWRGIKEVLESNGTQVLITRVPATSSPADRAKVLSEKISSAYPGRAVHLIGHSMGGLDCRFLASQLPHPAFEVLSITTIATPHRGSSFADHFLATVGKARMPSVLSLLDMLPNGGGDGTAFESLTVESMRRFNEECPDKPGVKYFSWGAVYDPGLIDTWKWPHSVIMEKEGPNDGLVSVESSKWGTYLGTLTNVNHLDLVGWINTARYKWAEMLGKEIKFRPATFYLGIADMLAREVDGLVGEGNEQELSPSPSPSPTPSPRASPTPTLASKSRPNSRPTSLRSDSLHSGSRPASGASSPLRASTPAIDKPVAGKDKAGKGVELAEQQQQPSTSSPEKPMPRPQHRQRQSTSAFESQSNSQPESDERKQTAHAQAQMVKSLRHVGADVHRAGGKHEHQHQHLQEHSDSAQAARSSSSTGSGSSNEPPSGKPNALRRASTIGANHGAVFDAEAESRKMENEKMENEGPADEDDGDITPTMQQSTATITSAKPSADTLTAQTQTRPSNADRTRPP